MIIGLNFKGSNMYDDGHQVTLGSESVMLVPDPRSPNLKLILEPIPIPNADYFTPRSSLNESKFSFHYLKPSMIPS